MVLVLSRKNGLKKIVYKKLNGIEVVLTIFKSTRVPVFGRENIPSQMRFEEKKCSLLGRTTKVPEESMTLPSGERTFVSVFSVISLVFRQRRVLTVHGG